MNKMNKNKIKRINKVSKTRPLSNPTLSETQCGEQRGDTPTPPSPHTPTDEFPNPPTNEFPHSPTNEFPHSHINTFPNSHINTFKEDPLFSDLQPLFDDQSRRLSALLNQPSAQLPALNYRRALTFRRLMLCCWLPLAIFSLSITIFWAFDLWNYNYDNAYILYNIIAEIILIFASIHATVAALAFLLHHPARTSLHSTLRYARFFNMYSPYMPTRHPRPPCCPHPFQPCRLPLRHPRPLSPHHRLFPIPLCSSRPRPPLYTAPQPSHQ